VRLPQGHQYQGFGSKGRPDVDAAREKSLLDTALVALIRDVHTFLTTLESDAHEGGDQFEVFELAFVYRAHVAAGCESLQCRFKWHRGLA
jgi:hypothetical protein